MPSGAEPHRFKVGDRVRVTYGGPDFGKVGTVMKIIDETMTRSGQYLTVSLDGEDWRIEPNMPWYPHYVGSSLEPLVD